MTEEVQRVWQDNANFEVTRRNHTIEFTKGVDGSFFTMIDGYQKETFFMTAEAFAAFQKWVAQN